MKTYELILPEGSKDTFKMSLVKDPAVEATLVKFSKDERPIFFANEEKREIYSVAMRPDKMIFRKDVNGEPANVFYSKETVEKLQQNYFKNNSNASSNIQHEEKDTEGIYPFESWIVKDVENDKTKFLNMDVQQGDWIMAFKIENDEIWEKCKNGDLDGLSIEGKLLHKICEQKKDVTMNKERFLKAVEFLFGSEEEKTPEQIEAEKKAAEEKMAEEAAAKAKAEEEAAAAEAEKKKKEEMADELTPEAFEALKSENARLTQELSEAKEEISKLKAESSGKEADLETMKAESTKMKAELVKMAAIKDKPKEETKEYAQMSNYEKMKHNRGK